MTAKKPTIIFVPGAWHGPDAFSEVSGILEAAGYITRGVNLASVGAEKAISGFGRMSTLSGQLLSRPAMLTKTSSYSCTHTAASLRVKV